MRESKKISLFNMNNQSKTIIIFWFFSSLLIFFTAVFVIDKTQQKIEESYRNFGLMLTRTLATESIDLIKGLPVEEKQIKLKTRVKVISDIKLKTYGADVSKVEDKEVVNEIFIELNANEIEGGVSLIDKFGITDELGIKFWYNNVNKVTAGSNQNAKNCRFFRCKH